MSRITGAVPQFQYAPTPIAGGSPQAIQGAYNQNFQTADQINRGLAGSIERGYQDVAAAQRDAQDLLGAGYADLGARSRQRSDELRDRVLGTGVDARGIPTGHLGIMQQGWDWLQDNNRDVMAGRQRLYDDAMEDVRSLGQTERLDLEERYRRAGADSAMGLARRGLGNSTLVENAQRGIDFDRARASQALMDTLTRERLDVRGRFGTAVQDQLERVGNRNLAQQNAISRARAEADTGISQFGTRGELDAYQGSLGAQERGYNANTALGLNQLGWMNSIQAPYPDARQYAALAAAAGQSAAAGNGFPGVSGTGGHTVTRGGPWNPPGLQSGGGRVPIMDGRGNTIGYGTREQAMQATQPLTREQTGGLDPRWVAAYQPGAYNQAILANAGIAPQPAPNPYGGAGQAPTGGGVAGPGPAPAQLDDGGATAGGGLVSAGPLSESPYAPPATGFGGGYGNLVSPAQLAGGGGGPGIAPNPASPFAPQAGGFGGGFGGGGYSDADWLFALTGEG